MEQLVSKNIELSKLIHSSKRIGLELVQLPEEDSEEGNEDAPPSFNLWCDKRPGVNTVVLPEYEWSQEEILSNLFSIAQDHQKTIYMDDLHQWLCDFPFLTNVLRGDNLVDLAYCKAWSGYAKTSLQTFREEYGKSIVLTGMALSKMSTRASRRFFKKFFFPMISSYSDWESTNNVEMNLDDSERPVPCRIYYEFCQSKTSRLIADLVPLGYYSEKTISPHMMPKNKRSEIVKSSKNKSLVGIDYKSAEIRVLAALSEDPRMTSCFEKNADIYDVLGRACNMNNRPVMKRILLSFVYGSSARRISVDHNMTISRVEEIRGNIAKFFPVAIDFIKDLIEQGKKNGKCMTLTGRVFRVQEESEAKNFPNYIIQSTTADLNNVVCGRLIKKFRHSRMMFHLHDGYIFEIDDEDISREVKGIVEEARKNPFEGIGLKNLFLDVSVSGPSKVWDF